MVFLRDDLRVDIVEASSEISPADSECIGSIGGETVSVFFLEALRLEVVVIETSSGNS